MTYPKEYTVAAAYTAVLEANGYKERKAEIAKVAVEGTIDFWRSHGYVSSKKEPDERSLNRQAKRHVRSYVTDRVKAQGTYEFVFLPFIIGGIISGVVAYLVRWWLTDTYGAGEAFAKPDPPTTARRNNMGPNRTRTRKGT